MDEKYMKVMITTFVLVIIGAVLVTIIADQALTKTQLSSVTETNSLVAAKNVGGGNSTINQSYQFSLVKGQVTGWRADDVADCGISTIVLKNSTGASLTAGTCGAGADYVYTANSGNYTMCNSALTNLSFYATNTSTVTFNYCGDDYLASGWSRTILNLTPGFVAIAILAGSLLFLYWFYRNQ